MVYSRWPMMADGLATLFHMIQGMAACAAGFKFLACRLKLGTSGRARYTVYRLMFEILRNQNWTSYARKERASGPSSRLFSAPRMGAVAIGFSWLETICTEQIKPSATNLSKYAHARAHLLTHTYDCIYAWARMTQLQTQMPSNSATNSKQASRLKLSSGLQFYTSYIGAMITRLHFCHFKPNASAATGAYLWQVGHDASSSWLFSGTRMGAVATGFSWLETICTLLQQICPKIHMCARNF